MAINRRLRTGVREAARKALEGRTAARAIDLAPVVAEIKAGGRTSLRAIASELDARRIPAPRGGKWTAPAVMRLLSATPARSPLRQLLHERRAANVMSPSG